MLSSGLTRRACVATLCLQSRLSLLFWSLLTKYLKLVSNAYPLQGQLISGPELEGWLRDTIATTRHEALLCSAYIRSAAFVRLVSSRTLAEPLRASVLVRWQAPDLLSSASDLALFPVCRERNIDLFLKLDFHGKVYAVPPTGIGVGSTNATASGLGFGIHPNAEMNTLVTCTDENLRIVRSQFNGATRITDQLYERIRLELEVMQKGRVQNTQWSSEVMSLLQPPTSAESLLVDECLATDGGWWNQGHGSIPVPGADHDLRLLGLVGGAQGELQLQAALRQTKCVRWLTERVRQAPACELYFGALSSALHDALLDDPGPRRAEVKTLLQNLLSWVQLARLPELSVDRPNHSQRVRLLSHEA